LQRKSETRSPQSGVEGRAPHYAAGNCLENGDRPEPIDQARSANIDGAGDETPKQDAPKYGARVHGHDDIRKPQALSTMNAAALGQLCGEGARGNCRYIGF
jgi:hypothetical protein